MTTTPNLPPLPIPGWARDFHGEAEVYTPDDSKAYALAAYQAGMMAAAEIAEAATLRQRTIRAGVNASAVPEC